MTSGGRVALIVVPPGTRRPEPLAGAIRRDTDEVGIVALWAGDPGVRPVLDGLDWIDGPTDELVLIRHDPMVAEWRLAVAATGSLLQSGAAAVAVAWAGTVAVRGGIDELFDAPPGAMRCFSVDGGGRDGPCSPYVATFAAGSQPVLAAIDRCLEIALPRADVDDAADPGAATVCRVLASVAGAYATASAGEATVTVAPAPSSVVVMPGFDSTRPWATAADEPAEILAAAMTCAEQFSGRREPLRLPGGMAVDGTIRSAVAVGLALTSSGGPPVPSPWSAPGAFRAWLEERYWTQVRERRIDLLAAFPDPTMAAGSPFERWSARAFVDDHAPFALGRRSSADAHWRVPARPSADGVNLVGYARRASGLGDDVRRLVSGLATAGVPTALLAYERTGSPIVEDPPTCDDEVTFETTVAIVTAVQFPVLANDHPEVFTASKWMIGYWMWEIEQIPKAMRPAFELVDEIWTGSQFITESFAAATDVPVRTLTIPVPEPSPSTRTRETFAPIADIGDRPLFVTVLDHFSVTERKNPVGTIRAFRRAFADGEGPVLLIKTMNAAERWDAHQRILFEAEGRSDIRVWDAHLTRADQMALVRSSDCLVSLHRGEGLGLHLAEAMWMSVPTIATRYSGNLEFMDDDNSLLIDAEQVPIRWGEGVYPESARWADPDPDEAADAMRRIAESVELRHRLGERGRARMAAQPSLADIGRQIAELTSLTRS